MKLNLIMDFVCMKGFNMKRILVSGSRGFLGKELVKQLREEYPKSLLVGVGRHGGSSRLTDTFMMGEGDYEEFNCDITNPLWVCELLEGVFPDIIFHLAGNPLIKLDENYPTEATKVNIIGTQNLLHYCQNVPKFILASSATVYGDNPLVSFEHSPLCPSSAYAATKMGAEGMVTAYHKMGRIKSTILRYIANVGGAATHGVVRDFIKKINSKNEFFEILGKCPGSSKPYMHVSDTISATISISKKNNYSDWNIGPSDMISSLDIANIIMKQTNIFKPIKWLGDEANWAGDNKFVKINNKKLMDTGWKPKYCTSEKAIIQAIKEYI